MKLLILLLVVAVNISFISANAGIQSPLPRLPCSSEDTSGCGNKVSCIDLKVNEANRQNYDISQQHQFTIYQANPFYVQNVSSNTYTLELFVEGQNIAIGTYQENTNLQGVGQFSVDIAKIDASRLHGITFDPPVKGYFQLTFDARMGGGEVYYSCADVYLMSSEAYTKYGTTNYTAPDKDSANKPNSSTMKPKSTPKPSTPVTDSESETPTPTPTPVVHSEDQVAAENPESSAISLQFNTFTIALLFLSCLLLL
ncbi:hypothetical protein DLAC_07107 [Tieghemostelium lacteum]|uniref:Carbohydrate binding domain-containing protein n=1 Tax=Tieghemostelium lacteum TaxID=361077 RepID=A0A151ZEB7_TIELA|nr:hypothetical protein DLAC_07107 [Tieghemostelium lacteum]|eukprot:KYQ92259.1 hypothetical protein DLAC_07107 [Tieghemostelium lacteum]